MKTLKDNFGSIRSNKEDYLPPSCGVYNLEMEGMICESSGDEVTGESEEIGYGGEFPGFSFLNSNN